VAKSRSYDPSQLLAELDNRVEQEGARFRQDIQTDAANKFAVTRRELEQDIALLRYESRDIKEEILFTEQKIEKLTQQRKKEIERLERQRLLERDMPEVRRLLSPFISPGHVQPKTSAWDVFWTPDSHPVSLSRLENIGALNRTMKGLETLRIFGGMYDHGSYNDRPLGAFPSHDSDSLSKPRILEPLKRSQELLRMHGRALVEQKMLSP
jgi:hypothetical protein